MLRVVLDAEVLLTGAVLRLYVLVGFLETGEAPKVVLEDGAYVTGAGETSGCTVSYRAGAGDGAGCAVAGATSAGAATGSTAGA